MPHDIYSSNMMTDSITSYGRRLLPQVVDELRDSTPPRVYTSYPTTADVKDGFSDFTMADLGRCTDYMAAWIENKFGKSNSFETITYVALSECRGPVTFLAAVKAGYKVSECCRPCIFVSRVTNMFKLLIPSPRNSAVVNESLMKQTESTKLLFANELAPLIKPLQDLVPSIRTEALPSLQEMLDSDPPRYSYSKTFEDARNDPIVVLHSSGSTGERLIIP
jgi:hypothetical protein